MSQNSNYFKNLNDLITEYNLDSDFVLRHYQSFIQRRDLPRLIAHYELFKKIINVPGSIIEIGVNYGQGLLTFANLLETFCCSDRTRIAIGFEAGNGYKKFSSYDKKMKAFAEKNNNDFSPSQKLLEELIEIKTADNLLKGVPRAKIIFGDVVQTLPKFMKDNGGLRLSMLYIDVNLYEPTKYSLEYLYPLVVPGGIVAFNGYAAGLHNGESKAVDDFLNSSNYKIEMKKFEFSSIPSVYFTKQ